MSTPGRREAEFGIVGAAYADILLLLFTIVFLVGFTFFFGPITSTTLAYLHLFHLFAAIPGFIILLWEPFFSPQYFTVLSVLLIILDGILIIFHITDIFDILLLQDLFATLGSVILLGFAFLFLFTSLLYFFSSLRAYGMATDDAPAPPSSKSQATGTATQAHAPTRLDAKLFRNLNLT